MTYKDYAALLVDAQEELLYISDIDTYEMLFMSKAAMEISGVKSEEDYRGKKCYEVVQNETSPCSFCTNSYLLEGKSPYTWERYNPVAKKCMRYENYYMEIDGRRCRGEVAIDLSRDNEAVDALQKQFELENVIHRSMNILSTENDADKAIDKFLECVGEYYQAERVAIFEINRTRNVVDNTYEWCAENVISHKNRLLNIPIDSTVTDIIEPFESGQTVRALNSGNMSGPLVALFDKPCELLMAPLRRSGKLVGFFEVDAPSIHGKNAYILNLFENLIVEGFNRRFLMSSVENLEHTDKLTGLPNRAKFFKVMEDYQANIPSSLAVYMINMNGVKDINEKYGQEVGDQTIKSCADLLLGFNIPVYRTNGDEFILLYPNVDKKQALATEAEIRSELRNKLYPHSASLGLAWNDKIEDVFQLTNEADEKMYADKQVYYRNCALAPEVTRLGNASEVLEEIKNDRFVVYYQPQYSLNTGEIYGAEALVRKVDAEGNIVFPNDFIHKYEVEGVISHLDFHVLELVCKTLKGWNENFGKQPKISVNFSRQTLLEPEVVNRAYAVCKKYGIPTKQIMIEITESTGKLSQEQLENLLGEFRGVGFSVSLDDFGSKYSNLSIFTAIDFDLIKLDKSLIDQVCDEDRGNKVVRSLLNLCHDAISTATLAEGVETKEQATILRDAVCDYVQGYFFARPMPEAQFTELLKNNTRFPVEDLPRTEEEVLFSKSELLTSIAKNSSSILGYHIKSRHAILPQKFANTYQLPTYIPDLPNWMVEHDRVSPRYKKKWYAIFEKFERGENVDEIIQMRNRFGGDSRFHLSSEIMTTSGEESDFVMLFLDNITSEQEQIRRQTQDVEALLQLTRNIFPEILTLNVTNNTYRIVQYHEGTNRGTPREGIISDMLEIRRMGVVEEDRELFSHDLSIKNLKKRLVEEGKESVSATYRRPGRDGKIYWFETTVMRQQHAGDDELNEDILFIAVSRPIDKEKSEEMHLRDELYMKEQEVRLTKERSNRFFCYYDVKRHSLRVPADYAKSHHMSETVENYPECLDRSKSPVDPDILKALRGFYDSICRGDAHGATEFKSRTENGVEHWKRMEFDNVFDMENKPARAVITVEDFTKESSI